MRFTLLILLLWLVLSCGTEPFELNDNQITEAERQLLNECSADALQDSLMIADNLLGEWELIGHACGSCAAGGPPIEVLLKFSENNNGVVSYEYNGFVEGFTFDWALLPYEFSSGTVYILQTSPPREYLYIPSFCSDYMYADNLANDGSMYIYQKQ